MSQQHQDADLKRREELRLEAEKARALAEASRDEAVVAARRLQAYDQYLATVHAAVPLHPAVVATSPAPIKEAEPAQASPPRAAGRRGVRATATLTPVPAPATKGQVARDQTFQTKAQTNRSAVASGERPTLKNAMVAVMGPRKHWKAEEVLETLVLYGLNPDSTSPLNYIRSTLSAPKFFERVAGKPGFFKARTEAYHALPAELIKQIEDKKKQIEAKEEAKEPTLDVSSTTPVKSRSNPPPAPAPAPQAQPSLPLDAGAQIMEALGLPDLPSAPPFV